MFKKTIAVLIACCALGQLAFAQTEQPSLKQVQVQARADMELARAKYSEQIQAAQVFAVRAKQWHALRNKLIKKIEFVTAAENQQIPVVVVDDKKQARTIAIRIVDDFDLFLNASAEEIALLEKDESQVCRQAIYEMAALFHEAVAELIQQDQPNIALLQKVIKQELQKKSLKKTITKPSSVWARQS